jgi:hypothetical protein
MTAATVTNTAISRGISQVAVRSNAPPSGLERSNVNSNSNNELEPNDVSSGAQTGALDAQTASIDADLAHVIDRWAALSPGARQAILRIADGQ